MAREVLTAKLDLVFKKFFVDNQDMLQPFVSSMMGVPEESISDLKILNPEMPPDDVSGKFSRLDLVMSMDKKLVNVEIQIRNEPDFRDRALYYWSILYNSGIKSGENYSELKSAITLNIIDFNMFEGKDFHREVNPIVKETGELFSDKMHIHFFELRKISKIPNPNNSREFWLQFINADSEEDFEMLRRTNDPTMQKAVRVIYDMSDDDRIREAARMREKRLHDEASALFNAEKKGRAEGRAERDQELIFKFKARGMSDEEINELLS